MTTTKTDTGDVRRSISASAAQQIGFKRLIRTADRAVCEIDDIASDLDKTGNSAAGDHVRDLSQLLAAVTLEALKRWPS